jgi:hypothetical protein
MVTQKIITGDSRTELFVVLLNTEWFDKLWHIACGMHLLAQVTIQQYSFLFLLSPSPLVLWPLFPGMTKFGIIIFSITMLSSY